MQNTKVADRGGLVDFSIIKAYYELFKPGVMSLAIMSAVVGIILGPGDIAISKLIWSMICIIGGAGSAGAINMYLEMDIDSRMTRTSQRPLPMQKINPQTAFEISIILGFFSVFFMAFFVNFLSAFLLFTTIVFYGYIYTLVLKRRTIYNVVIGGIPGALPPLIGWTAVTNSISLDSLYFFLIIFFWIPPHSWALALYRVKEYEKVGVPMMPVMKGRRYTIYQVLFYSILLVVSTYFPYLSSLSSSIYLYVTSLANAFLLYYLFKLYRNIDDRYNHKFDKLFFIFSINYLFIIFLGAIFDHYF